MIVTTTNELPGHRTVKVMGVARGAAIRSRHFGFSMLAFFRGLVGGEIVDYTKVIAETREQAFDRMVDDAKRMGANALLAIRFTSIEVMKNAAEIVVYGTAAVVEELQQEG
ncbi:MAG: YbjQ family protein [Planctomycetota bacterium]